MQEIIAKIKKLQERCIQDFGREITLAEFKKINLPNINVLLKEIEVAEKNLI